MKEVANSKEVFGKEIGLIHKAIITGRKVGADKRFWTVLADDEQIFKMVVKFVNARLSYKVIVDYNQYLEEMKMAGRYERVDARIKDVNFPVQQPYVGEYKLKVKVTLFRFDRDMELGEVVCKMYKEGYNPASLVELLAFGKQHPELSREFSIVALGSSWRHNGDTHFPYLDSHDLLLVECPTNDEGKTHFSPAWVFAAVQKQI